MSHEPSERSTLEGVRDAAQALVAGHLVVFPTETVYGIGADATNPAAVARVFDAKARPRGHPLIVHVASILDMDRWAIAIPEYAWNLASAFWPGPLTLILRKSDAVTSLVTGGQDTVGLRVPSHPVAQSLIRAFALAGGSGAVAAPSANRYGRVSPTSSEDVRAELSGYLLPGDRILDGGACSIGVESTIVDCTRDAPAIARPGAVTFEMVHSVTGMETLPVARDIRVSGSMASHYAPAARVVLDGEAEPGDGFLALTHHPTPQGAVRLLDAQTPEQFAHELYGALRRADSLGLARVVALLPEGDGISVAVRDRLTRASHGASDSASSLEV